MDIQIIATDPLFFWLANEGRLYNDLGEFTAELASRLRLSSIPVYQMKISLYSKASFIESWDAFWSLEKKSKDFVVDKRKVRVNFHWNRIVKIVMESQKPYWFKAEETSENDYKLHNSFTDDVTDCIIVPLIFSDGSVQVATFVTRIPQGFDSDDFILLRNLSGSISAALEPMFVRHSCSQILATYLGENLTKRVQAGGIRQGSMYDNEAVFVFIAMDSSEALSELFPPNVFLRCMNRHLEIISKTIMAEGGDILKFLNNGTLISFSIEQNNIEAVCQAALKAIQKAISLSDASGLPHFAATLHMGTATFGNIGSSDRMDFMLIGPIVNLMNRLDGIAKGVGERIVCSQSVAENLTAMEPRNLGRVPIRGFDSPIQVFALPREMPSAGRFLRRGRRQG